MPAAASHRLGALAVGEQLERPRVGGLDRLRTQLEQVDRHLTALRGPAELTGVGTAAASAAAAHVGHRRADVALEVALAGGHVRREEGREETLGLLGATARARR